MKEKKQRGKLPRVIRATISTVKARKIMNKVTEPYGEYSKDPLLRDVYLAGVRDIIGGDLGWAFRRAVLTGDMRQAARYCSDGWKVLKIPFDAFTTSQRMTMYLRTMRDTCAKLLAETEAR